MRDYLHVLRRRKWIVLQAVVLVPAAALAVSLQQSKLYEASADVLISRQNLAAMLTGTPDPTASQQPDRLLQTQADLARVRAVAARVVEETGFDGTANDFLAQSSVSAKANADLLVFKVSDRDREDAARLATEYARQYRIYRNELDTAALQRAKSEVTRRLRQLESAGQQGSALYASLADKEQQLSTLQALQTSNASVVQTAEGARQIQPRPVRNAILGLALGLILGLGLAFLFEAVDARVRSSDEVERELDTPLLGRLPRISGSRGARKGAAPFSE